MVCLMSLLTTPKIPLFRITLFYGPEDVDESSDIVHCVFNVKKRSWKGGVQVDIQFERSQLESIFRQLDVAPWVDRILKSSPSMERHFYRQRADDLLIQLICFYKLQEYIHQGIQQENSQVSPGQLFEETQLAVGQATESIKRQVVIELDIADGSENQKDSEA